MVRTRRLVGIGLLVGGLAASAGIAVAESPSTGGGYGYGRHPSGECKPGWGFGDQNHCHTGPRGLERRPDHGHGHHSLRRPR